MCHSRPLSGVSLPGGYNSHYNESQCRTLTSIKTKHTQKAIRRQVCYLGGHERHKLSDIPIQKCKRHQHTHIPRSPSILCTKNIIAFRCNTLQLNGISRLNLHVQITHVYAEIKEHYQKLAISVTRGHGERSSIQLPFLSHAETLSKKSGCKHMWKKFLYRLYRDSYMYVFPIQPKPVVILAQLFINRRSVCNSFNVICFLS